MRKEEIEFDEKRTIRALDKLFKENEELKRRVLILENLILIRYEKETKENVGERLFQGSE